MIGLFGQKLKEEKTCNNSDTYYDILRFLRDNPNGSSYDKVRKKFNKFSKPEMTRILFQLQQVGNVYAVDGLYFYSKKAVK